MPYDLKVYVGYDSREDIAFEVCRHSLLRLTSRPISVIPIRQTSVRDLGLYTRPVDPFASTDFSLTRFLTPYLADHDGWSVFVDCDFLFTADVHTLLPLLDAKKGVYAVQHKYEPVHAIKMDGRTQTKYPRKNWSSLMAFNGTNKYVRALTPRVVNREEPGYLHRLCWIPDDNIGELPLSWNYLVGEYDCPDAIPEAIHFTNGGPWFDDWKNVMFADVWNKERDLYLSGGRQRVY